MKKFLKRLLFGKPSYMNVVKDKHGNYYGGTILKDKNIPHVDVVSHIEEPEYIGIAEIYYNKPFKSE